jgi:hypothetical protein
MSTLKHLSLTALGATLALASLTARADPDETGYFEDWEDALAGTAQWLSSGGSCIARSLDDQDNGYLNVAMCEGIGGAAYLEDELSGDFSGSTWTLSADFRCFLGTCAEPSLRFYENDSDVIWIYEFDGVITDEWQTFSVTFDPSWSYSEAQNAGWTANTDSDFSDTMSNVGSTQLWINGTPPEIEGFLIGGIDNVTLEGTLESSFTIEVEEGFNSFDLGFVQVRVNVRTAGTETYQFCVAEVPDALDGKLFAANLLKNTGTCGDFDLGGVVPPTVRFFRDEADGILKVGVMRVDSNAVYDGLYEQVLTEEFLEQAPLNCLRDVTPPTIPDEPRTMVHDLEDFGVLYNGSTAECNQPLSLGRKRSTYLSPVKPLPNVAVATVAVAARIAGLYIHLARANLPHSVKVQLLGAINAASIDFLKKRYVNLVADFEQIARIAAFADDTNDTQNWLGLFWGQGLIAAFETSENIRRVVYTIPSDLEPIGVVTP